MIQKTLKEYNHDCLSSAGTKNIYIVCLLFLYGMS